MDLHYIIAFNHCTDDSAPESLHRNFVADLPVVPVPPLTAIAVTTSLAPTVLFTFAILVAITPFVSHPWHLHIFVRIFILGVVVSVKVLIIAILIGFVFRFRL
jgi:hypothetical protein